MYRRTVRLTGRNWPSSNQRRNKNSWKTISRQKRVKTRFKTKPTKVLRNVKSQVNGPTCKKKNQGYSATCIYSVLSFMSFLWHSLVSSTVQKGNLFASSLTFSFPVFTHVLVRCLWHHDWGWLAMGSDLGPGIVCWF